MPNTAMSLISERDLIALDTHVFTPQKQILSGRSLFQSFTVPRYTESYAYGVITTTGQARRSGPTGRNTDTPIGDENKSRDYAPMTMWEYGVEYTDDELGIARATGDSNFLNRKGDQAARAMAEYENKVIFNGVKEDNIVGITENRDKNAFQQLTPDTTLDKMNGEQLLNYFKTASHKITDLGYSTQKPILLITTEVETLLDTFYNEYRDTSVEDYISKYFSQIKVVKELEKQFTGRKSDMGIVMLNDYDTAGIADAIPVERQYSEHFEGRNITKYRQKFSGVVVRYPTHFVQLTDLLPDNKTVAKKTTAKK